MKNILNKDFFNLIDNKHVKEIIKKNHIREDFIENNIIFKYFRCYLIVNYSNELEIILDKNMLYLNKYYWFKKFYCKFRGLYGPDAAIEQQIGLLLEEMSNNVSNNFDWETIETIHNQFR